MTAGKQKAHSTATTVARAIELSDEALGQVARIAVEGIRCGLEASSHVEAAERDLRSALRQLVLAERELAERELRSRPQLGAQLDEQPTGITGVVP
jgi:hypothetical protein